MNVISLKEKRRCSSCIQTLLPNGSVFSAKEADMSELFDDPAKFLSEEEREGLMQIALAVLFADHKKRKTQRF